jgi:hypothetical protein
MSWVVRNIKGIMLVAGASTCTMIYAAIAPQAALQSTFGEGLEGPLAEIVVRNWGALITLVGAMLLYGAYHPPVRPLVLSVAAASKIVFIGLVLAHGGRFLDQAGIAIAVDVVLVALFVMYLLQPHRRSLATEKAPSS